MYSQNLTVVWLVVPPLLLRLVLIAAEKRSGLLKSSVSRESSEFRPGTVHLQLRPSSYDETELKETRRPASCLL